MALQRAGHCSPTAACIDHVGQPSSAADIVWEMLSTIDPEVVPHRRLTEHAAEAIALTYVHSWGRWSVKRVMNEGEFADWLLAREDDRLALEVGGVTGTDGRAKLTQKLGQIDQCTVAQQRLAVVVAFGKPEILAECR
ncbi:MAG: hypothetical protein FJX77_14035 [Armatimonadetes bacterium]|nr:hypothetical protein [Armatimonadota bacterium]